MFGLIKINNIEGKESIKDKLGDYEIIGVFNTLVEIENKYKNYYIHKYGLLGSYWCFLSKRNNIYTQDVVSKVSDMIVIDMESQIQQSQPHLSNFSDDFDGLFKRIIRELKISLLYD